MAISSNWFLKNRNTIVWIAAKRRSSTRVPGTMCTRHMTTEILWWYGHWPTGKKRLRLRVFSTQALPIAGCQLLPVRCFSCFTTLSLLRSGYLQPSCTFRQCFPTNHCAGQARNCRSLRRHLSGLSRFLVEQSERFLVHRLPRGRLRCCVALTEDQSQMLEIVTFNRTFLS